MIIFVALTGGLLAGLLAVLGLRPAHHPALTLDRRITLAAALPVAAILSAVAVYAGSLT